MELISKKQLLSKTGISYGQLYRWKRERLIPEEWFMKQSSYTGQETFFPKEKILNRIEAILEAKDQYSLEELAKMLTKTQEFSLSREDLDSMTEIEQEHLSVIDRVYLKESYSLNDLTLISFLSQAAGKLELDASQTEKLFDLGNKISVKVSSARHTCAVFLAGGNCHLVLAPSSDRTEELLFDDEITEVIIYPLDELANKIQLKYQSVGIPQSEATIQGGN